MKVHKRLNFHFTFNGNKENNDNYLYDEGTPF
jgi:hypothetical protein